MLWVIYNHQNVKSLLKWNDDFLEIAATKCVHPVATDKSISETKHTISQMINQTSGIEMCRNILKLLVPTCEIWIFAWDLLPQTQNKQYKDVNFIFWGNLDQTNKSNSWDIHWLQPCWCINLHFKHALWAFLSANHSKLVMTYTGRYLNFFLEIRI